MPQTHALPQCDVVVSHAGSETVLATVGLGLPQGADQFLTAAAVAAAGAGIALMPDEATTEAVGGARHLPAQRRISFGGAARRISDSIAAMPSPDDAAVLESLQ